MVGSDIEPYWALKLREIKGTFLVWVKSSNKPQSYHKPAPLSRRWTSGNTSFKLTTALFIFATNASKVLSTNLQNNFNPYYFLKSQSSQNLFSHEPPMNSACKNDYYCIQKNWEGRTKYTLLYENHLVFLKCWSLRANFMILSCLTKTALNAFLLNWVKKPLETKSFDTKKNRTK